MKNKREALKLLQDQGFSWPSTNRNLYFSESLRQDSTGKNIPYFISRHNNTPNHAMYEQTEVKFNISRNLEENGNYLEISQPLYSEVLCASSNHYEHNRNLDHLQNLSSNSTLSLDFPSPEKAHKRHSSIKVAIVKDLFLKTVKNVPEAIQSPFAIYLKRFNDFDLTILSFASALLVRMLGSELCTIEEFVKYFLACNIIAFKYKEDYCIFNSKMITGWNITIEEFNYVEAMVLNRVKYDLNITNY